MGRLSLILRAALALGLWLALALRPALAAESVSFASADGKLQLTGQWFPVEGAGKLPAVVALHGCNGMLDDKGQPNGVYRRYAGYFNAEQMHMLALDSFTPRGLQSVCEIATSRRTVFEEDRRKDVYAALQWLARQPGVDASRLVVLGWSHGAQTVLSVMDATDKDVQAQPVKPRVAVAFYPGCQKFQKMWDYQMVSPLLLMIGELDDWTPAADCVTLAERVRKQGAQPMEITVYPGSYHAFDGLGPVVVRENVGNTRSGKAMVGGNPQARQASHARMFDFLAAQLGVPLAMTHDQRLLGHFFELPPASGFARIDDAAAVPVTEAGRLRYRHYLELPSPKAFVVTEKGGWYFGSGDGHAMRIALEACKAAPCWLYAVDDRVVWNADTALRTGLRQLRRPQAAAR